MTPSLDAFPIAATRPVCIELIRVSSMRQKSNDTPKAQRRALAGFRALNPEFDYITVECEDAVSGALDAADRPDLQRVFALIRQGAKRVHVAKADRLSRHDDIRERAELIGFFKDHGVVVADCAGGVFDLSTENGEKALEDALRWAKQERHAIRARCMGGKAARAADGEVVTPNLPWWLAHDRSTGEWSFKPEPERIMRRLLAGLVERSLGDLAIELNAEGVTTPEGRRWTAATILPLVRHPAVVGEFRQRIGGQAFPLAVPALISREQRDLVIKALGRRFSQPRGRPGSVPVLLRGMTVCGQCGGKTDDQEQGRMRVGAKPNRTTRYWCKQCRHAANALDVDEAVWQAVVEVVRHPDRLRRVATPAPDDGESQAVLVARKEQIQKRLKQAKSRVQAAHDARAAGDIDDDELKNVLRERRRDVLLVEASLSEIQGKIAALADRATEKASVDDEIERLGKMVDTADFDERRAILQAMIPQAPRYGVFIRSGRVAEVRCGLSGSGKPPPKGSEVLSPLDPVQGHFGVLDVPWRRPQTYPAPSVPRGTAGSFP